MACCLLVCRDDNIASIRTVECAGGQMTARVSDDAGHRWPLLDRNVLNCRAWFRAHSRAVEARCAVVNAVGSCWMVAVTWAPSYSRYAMVPCLWPPTSWVKRFIIQAFSA